MISRSDFVFTQLKASAAGVIAKSKAINSHKHNGLKGTFREVLISDLLQPWLPPTCGAGTGAIICGHSNTGRDKGQDDIIIYDRSLMPPILANSQGTFGFFLYNSVLMRIEVKTTIDAKGIDDFIKSSIELSNLGFTFIPNSELGNKTHTAPFNVLIALDTNLNRSSNKFAEIDRFNKRALNIQGYQLGHVSALCVLGSGFFMLTPNQNSTSVWKRSSYNDDAGQLAQCIGYVSNSAVDTHVKRQGRDIHATFEQGLGLFMPDMAEIVP